MAGIAEVGNAVYTYARMSPSVPSLISKSLRWWVLRDGGTLRPVLDDPGVFAHFRQRKAL